MKRPKVSVLSPSNRGSDAINVVANALMRQDFEDFEWIIGSPEYPSGILLDFEWVQDPEKEDGDYWVLNKAYNELIRASKGELIISIQDNTAFDPDALSKFWFHYTQDNNSVVSGVGNKYADDSFTTKTWQDPREREDQGSFYECYFADIEFNFCSTPKALFYDVGGFDEYLDRYAGMDAYSVLERAEMLGKYKFYLDQTNKSYSLEHGRYKGWNDRNAINGAYQERKKFYKGNVPLDYLP